jgi:hypothetical protein
VAAVSNNLAMTWDEIQTLQLEVAREVSAAYGLRAEIAEPEDAALYELHKRLMAAVDSLNARWGKDTVRCGLFPNSGAWRTRFARRSPNYNTDWRQLMTAS